MTWLKSEANRIKIQRGELAILWQTDHVSIVFAFNEKGFLWKIIKNINQLQNMRYAWYANLNYIDLIISMIIENNINLKSG